MNKPLLDLTICDVLYCLDLLSVSKQLDFLKLGKSNLLNTGTDQFVHNNVEEIIMDISALISMCRYDSTLFENSKDDLFPVPVSDEEVIVLKRL